jgi:hypothetical protein
MLAAEGLEPSDLRTKTNAFIARLQQQLFSSIGAFTCVMLCRHPTANPAETGKTPFLFSIACGPVRLTCTLAIKTVGSHHQL